MSIPTDKKKHFFAGFAITAVVSLFFGYIIGAVAAILAGAGKEAYDKVTGKGTPEVLDFVATAAWAITAVAVSAGFSMICGVFSDL